MKPPPITDGIFPIRRGRLLIPVVSMALSMSIGLIELHAQTTGGNNVPPKKDIYELQEITDTPKGDTPLPIKLETYIKWLKKVNGEPESAPVDSDIQWAADKGEPIFDPSYGATVELDFGKPFVKENTDEAKKVKVTATYSGSASVENSPRTKDVKRIYLDFWIAETKESDDDVLVVRAEDAQVAEDDKKVIHWAKVLVKHSAPSVLPLQLESTGEKKLYFYGEQQDPNQLPEDPPLEETLEKEYADGEWFWIGTEEKGTGKGKFKAQADAGTGYKDAPEEKTVDLLPVEVRDIKDSTNTDDDVTITPWDTATQTNPTDANIAWIEPHKSDTDAAPRMPQLVLNIPGLPQSVTLDAKLLVVYERPYAGKQADDTVKIPADGSFQTVANGRWEIFSQYTNLPFFGGDATITYKINGGTEQTIKFAIGGRNPDDIRCKTYTQERPASPWYAYAIERHESQAYNPGHYNQFWERHGNNSPINNGVNYTFTRGDALIVRSPGETGVGGTGIAQVTGAAGNKTVSAPREIFWNWQKNVDAFLVIMSAKIQIAETFMNDPTPRNGPGSMPNGQRPQTTFHTGNNVAVPSRLQGIVTFGDAQNNKPPEDAVAIKAYNGASSHWCSWRGPSVHEWQFNYGQNNYVEEVCNEIEEAQP